MRSESNKDSERKLRDAARAGNKAQVRTLLASNVNPNTRDSDGNTALHLACLNSINDPSSANALLDSFQINVNATNNQMNTPSHLLAANGDTRTLEKILQLGANPFATNDNGDSLAHMAQKNERARSLQVILKNAYPRDVLVNLLNNDSESILHVAARANSPTIYMLLVIGADSTLRNADGKLPEDLCASKTMRNFLCSHRKGIEENRSTIAPTDRDADDDSLLAARADDAKRFISNTTIARPPCEPLLQICRKP